MYGMAEKNLMNIAIDARRNVAAGICGMPVIAFFKERT
jgi:hypothetical protein